MNLLNKILRRSNFPKHKHETKYAFTIDGTDYFQFADFNNMPALRGLKTTVFYEELRMKCTLEFLKLHTAAIDNILSQSKINVFDIKKLNDQLKQRLEIAIDLEIAYKVASIIYFDANENVEDYDFEYNIRKIEFWKKEMGTAVFFCQQPLQELMPVLKSIGNNLQMYSEVVEKLNNLHLENLLLHLPESKMKTLKGKSYFSLAVMDQS